MTLRTKEEIKTIGVAGKILSKIMAKILKEAKEGVSLSDLNKLAYQLTKKEKAQPAFLGYRPDGAAKAYGASICASVNEVVVHGFPSDYKLRSGDVLKIDFGVEYNNYFADAAATIGIGKISKEAKHLIKITKLALERAVKIAKPGNTIGDIGWIIQKTAKDNKLKVVKGLTGHGIGMELHEEPTIHNYGEKGKGIRLEPGMVLAIEPMFAIGGEEVVQRADEGWATADNSLSAHFEHTIVITPHSSRALTAF
jgi:methionyl aminopeptidase